MVAPTRSGGRRAGRAALIAFVAACGAPGRISTRDAPGTWGASTFVWAGKRLLVVSYAGPGRSQARTYDPDRDDWRIEPAIPAPYALQRARPAVIGAGDVVLILGNGTGTLFDGLRDRWETIPTPRLDEGSEVFAQGGRVLVYHYDSRPVL